MYPTEQSTDRAPASRTVLVTGGSQGIGRACVVEFARRGVDVGFTYRHNVDAAEMVVRDTVGLPGRVRAFRHDLLDGDASALVTGVEDLFGPLDGAVLNAGIWAGGRLDQLDPETWWRVLETNLRGNHRLARAALPGLLRSPSGSLVLVSSAVALTGFPGDTAYASAKAAMIGFARSLAHEVGGHGVRVNVLAPGFIDTELTSAISQPARERILRRTVLGRFGTVEEIARAAVFLAEDATFTTGTVLSADGGWTL
jgi:3-oxoacyl-[acyl-carrier protein] reductase